MSTTELTPCSDREFREFPARMREWLYVVMQQMVSHAPHPPTQSPGTGAWGQADRFGVFRGTGDAFGVFRETGLGCSGRGVWGVFMERV